MSTDKYPIGYTPQFYSHLPRTLYEKYVEAWYFICGKELSKKRAQELANYDWKQNSVEEKNALIQKHIQRIRKRKTLFSFGFNKKKVTAEVTSTSHHADLSSVHVDLSNPNVSTSNSTRIQSSSGSTSVSDILITENASTIHIDADRYVSSQNRSVIDIFLAYLGEECRKFLDDPHVGDSKILMDALLSLAFVYNDLRLVLEEYENGKSKSRVSELSKLLTELYCKRNDLKRLILEEMQVNITPKLGLLELRTNADRKDSLY